MLEDLRLLSNLETAKEKILQIVLSGQPELGQKLGNPGLRQLRQRVAVSCRLLPLTREELTEYIQSRLTAAGAADPKLFTRDAEERIFEISTGIPRLVNIVCDNALVIGYALGKKRIGADVVNEAAADLLTAETRGISLTSEPVDVATPQIVATSPPRSRCLSQIGVITVVVIALVIGLLSVGRSLLRRDTGLSDHSSVPRAPLEVVQPGMRELAPPRVARLPANEPAAPPAAPIARPQVAAAGSKRRAVIARIRTARSARTRSDGCPLCRRSRAAGERKRNRSASGSARCSGDGAGSGERSARHRGADSARDPAAATGAGKPAQRPAG